MKSHFICLSFLFILLSGCETNPTKYNHLRAGSIAPNSALYESIKIGEVTSAFGRIPTKDLKEAFTKSLSGNNYLSENDKFKVNISLTKGSINGVFTQEVSLTVNYEVISTLTDTTIFTKSIESKAIVTTSKLAPLFEGVNYALTGHLDHRTNIVTTNAYRSSRKEDIEFGFPELGTPISAKPADLRINYMIDTALRKNFADFLKQLNSSVTEVY